MTFDDQRLTGEADGWSRFAPQPSESAWGNVKPAPPRWRGTKLSAYVAAVAVAGAMVVLVIELALTAAFRRRIGDATQAEAVVRDIDRARSIAMASLLVTIVAGIAVMVWLTVAYRSTDRLGLKRRHRPFMAVVGWLIPLANLVIPGRILSDMAGVAVPRVAKTLRRLVIVWALLFWAPLVGNRISVVLIERSETVSDLRTALDVGMAGATVRILAGALFIVIVVTIARLLVLRGDEEDAEASALASGPVRWRAVASCGAAFVVALSSAGIGALRAGSSTAQTIVGGSASGDVDLALATSLTVGTCLPDALLLFEPEVFAVPTVSCDQVHEAEVAGVVHLPTGPWPGYDEIERVGVPGCMAAMHRYVGMSLYQTPFDVTFFMPLETNWPADDVVPCVGLLPAPGRGSIRNMDLSDGWHGIYTSDALEPGACTSPADPVPGNVTLVDCAEPHAYEMIGTHDIREDVFPGEASVERTAHTICQQRFRHYVGVDAEESDLELVYTVPLEYAWEHGDRRIACLLEKHGLTGSARDSQQRRTPN